MSDLQEYLMRLERQRPKVESIRDEARANGDFVTVSNCDKLLSEWAELARRFTPANDIELGLVNTPSF